MKLTYKQTIAFRALESKRVNQAIFGGAAGGGKSAFGCWWQLRRRIKYPGTRGLIGRSIGKTLKETTLQTFHEIAKKQKLKFGLHYKMTSPQDKEFPQCLLFRNGSMIYLKDLFDYPSDPDFDELGSLELTDAFIDEAVQVSKKAWDTVYSRLRFKLDEYNLTPSLLGATNPGKGHIYTDFYVPYTNGNLPANKAFVPALIPDNPHVSKYYAESLAQINENQKQRLLFGNWDYDDDPAALLTYSDMVECSKVKKIPGIMYTGADIARHGDDNTSIADICGNFLSGISTYKKYDTAEIANITIKHIQKNKVSPENLGIDTVGLGAGVYDNMKEKGFEAIEIISGNKPTKSDGSYEFKNLRSQMWWQFRTDCKEGIISINLDDPELLADLTAPRYKIVNDRVIQVESKDDIKKRLGRSPDKGDSVVYANAMRAGIIKRKKTLRII